MLQGVPEASKVLVYRKVRDGEGFGSRTELGIPPVLGQLEIRGGGDGMQPFAPGSCKGARQVACRRDEKERVVAEQCLQVGYAGLRCQGLVLENQAVPGTPNLASTSPITLAVTGSPETITSLSGRSLCSSSASSTR